MEEPVIKTASSGFAAQFAAQVAAVADVKKDKQPVVDTKPDAAPGNKAADTPIQVFFVARMVLTVLAAHLRIFRPAPGDFQKWGDKFRFLGSYFFTSKTVPRNLCFKSLLFRTKRC